MFCGEKMDVCSKGTAHTVFAISTAGGTHFDWKIVMIKLHRSGSIGLKSFNKFVMAYLIALQSACLKIKIKVKFISCLE